MSTETLKLIVHADDFGISERINEGILQAYLHGVLTSTSIMASGAAFEHAISMYESTPTLDVGVHLTLVEEQPALDAEIVQSLVDRDGKLHPHASIFTSKYLTGRINLGDVQRELEAQIKKVISYGVSVTHLDSHQHLHMLPRIRRITVELAKKYDIPAIRFPRERVRIAMLKQHGSISRVLQLFVLNLFCHLGRNAIRLRTDHFVGFFYGGNLHKDNLQKVLEHLPPSGVCELGCHPGLDDLNTRYSHWGYCWEDELKALMDPEVSDWLQRKGIQLISYRQFADSCSKNEQQSLKSQY